MRRSTKKSIPSSAEIDRHYGTFDTLKLQKEKLSKDEQYFDPETGGWSQKTAFEMPKELDKEMRSPVTKLLRKEQVNL